LRWLAISGVRMKMGNGKLIGMKLSSMLRIAMAFLIYCVGKKLDFNIFSILEKCERAAHRKLWIHHTKQQQQHNNKRLRFKIEFSI